MNQITTGEIDGETIWRDETSFDRIARWAEAEHNKQLDKMAGVDDETVNKVEIDPDSYKDNDEDR